MRRMMIVLFMSATIFAAMLVVARGGADAVSIFSEQPKVERKGDDYVITFAVQSECDVTVWVTEAKTERIVRRLAVGCLGANAPEPFQKGTLEQRLTWDGKDDHGSLISAGSVVHVGLGLQAGFNRMLYQMGSSVSARGPASIACDSQGTLYIMWGHMRSACLGGLTINITAFDRDGNYLRTIMPFRADWPEEKVSAVDFLATADGRRVPLTGPNRYSPMDGFLPGVSETCRHNAQITRDGRYIFPSARPVADSKGVVARRLLSIGTDGSCPKDLFAGPPLHKSSTTGEKFLALSPDEKYVYISRTYNTAKKKRGHCVYRMQWGDTEAPKPFVGIECEYGSDNAHFKGPRGIATDSDGRLYVCDYDNDRIQIFSSHGTYLKSMELPGPEQLVIHPKTGAMYVLSIRSRGETESYVNKRWETYADKSIVKFSSFEDPKEVARIDFPKQFRYFHDCGPMLALDASAEKPVLWICSVVRGTTKDFLRKIVDEGTTLKSVEHCVVVQKGWASTQCPLVAASPDNDEFYLAGGNLSGALSAKAGKGEVVPFALPQGATDWLGAIGAGSDGMLYLSSGKVVNPPKDMRWVIRRYTRDGKLVPFMNGEGIETLGYHAGTYSGEMCGPFDVGPDGSIYVSECSAPGGKTRAMVNVYGPDGELRTKGLIAEATHTAPPLAVDGAGRLYVADSIKRTGIGPGKEFPAFLGTDPRGHFQNWYGTVFRFRPEGGSFQHVGIDEDYTHVGGYSKGNSTGKVIVKGAMWEYFGMSPMPQSSTCECKVARMDADRFGRVFVPDLSTYSIQVLDPAGNLMLRFGEYGGIDAQGAGSSVLKPEIPLYYPLTVAALDRYVAITDSLNRRVIEVRLFYEVEATALLP